MKKFITAFLLLAFFAIIPKGGFTGFRVDDARPLMITSGIAMMIIGNQDRNTDSGKLLKAGGFALAFTWTF